MTVWIAERELGYTFSQSLHQGGMQRALVVCGYEKIDGISADPKGFESQTMTKYAHTGRLCTVPA